MFSFTSKMKLVKTQKYVSFPAAFDWQGENSFSDGSDTFEKSAVIRNMKHLLLEECTSIFASFIFSLALLSLFESVQPIDHEDAELNPRRMRKFKLVQVSSNWSLQYTDERFAVIWLDRMTKRNGQNQKKPISRFHEILNQQVLFSGAVMLIFLHRTCMYSWRSSPFLSTTRVYTMNIHCTAMFARVFGSRVARSWNTHNNPDPLETTCRFVYHNPFLTTVSKSSLSIPIESIYWGV